MLSLDIFFPHNSSEPPSVSLNANKKTNKKWGYCKRLMNCDGKRVKEQKTGKVKWEKYELLFGRCWPFWQQEEIRQMKRKSLLFLGLRHMPSKEFFFFNPDVLASPAWSYKIKYSVLMVEPSDYMTLQSPPFYEVFLSKCFWGMWEWTTIRHLCSLPWQPPSAFPQLLSTAGLCSFCCRLPPSSPEGLLISSYCWFSTPATPGSSLPAFALYLCSGSRENVSFFRKSDKRFGGNKRNTSWRITPIYH